MKKQSLKFLGIILALGVLSSCASMPNMAWPDMNGMMGPKYKPLTYDVAHIAAPRAINASAGANDALYCQAGKGAALFGKTWVDFKAVNFTLQTVDRTTVALTPVKGSGSFGFQGFFDLDGQKLIFCPVVAGDPDERISCASIYALDDDLQMGIKRTFDIPDTLRGGQISCAYDTAKLQKL